MHWLLLMALLLLLLPSCEVSRGSAAAADAPSLTAASWRPSLIAAALLLMSAQQA